MFSRFKIYAIAIIALTILGLCGWIWHQSKNIDELRAENQVQAQTIKSQEQVNQSLKDTIETERQALVFSMRTYVITQHSSTDLETANILMKHSALLNGWSQVISSLLLIVKAIDFGSIMQEF